MSRRTPNLRLWIALCLALCWSDRSKALGSDQEILRSFEVTASRFQFQPSRLEVNLGDRVSITLRSTDVDHGFSLPVFDVEAQIPAGGEPVTIEFVADKPGTFPFGCITVCGEGHFGMLGELVVLSAEGRDAAEANLVEADFNLVNLPTTRRLPQGGMAFRITHRFSRPLGQGSFLNLVEDSFGLDGGAQTGLEFRYGVSRVAQVGFYRTSDRTIEFFTQGNLVDQGRIPIGVGFVVSLEGVNNFQRDYSSAWGVVVSRRLWGRAAVYLVPRWVANTNFLDVPAAGTGRHSRLLDSSTVVLGIGARALLSDSVAVVAEISPRVAGFDEGVFGGPTDASASFGVEAAYGSHVFQVNFSNHVGTTPAQIARGRSGSGWFIGFNYSKKIF